MHIHTVSVWSNALNNDIGIMFKNNRGFTRMFFANGSIRRRIRINDIVDKYQAKADILLLHDSNFIIILHIKEANLQVSNTSNDSNLTATEAQRLKEIEQALPVGEGPYDDKEMETLVTFFGGNATSLGTDKDG